MFRTLKDTPTLVAPWPDWTIAPAMSTTKPLVFASILTAPPPVIVGALSPITITAASTVLLCTVTRPDPAMVVPVPPEMAPAWEIATRSCCSLAVISRLPSSPTATLASPSTWAITFDL